MSSIADAQEGWRRGGKRRCRRALRMSENAGNTDKSAQNSGGIALLVEVQYIGNTKE